VAAGNAAVANAAAANTNAQLANAYRTLKNAMVSKGLPL
jgi:hypothetical protein